MRRDKTIISRLLGACDNDSLLIHLAIFLGGDTLISIDRYTLENGGLNIIAVTRGFLSDF